MKLRDWILLFILWALLAWTSFAQQGLRSGSFVAGVMGGAAAAPAGYTYYATKVTDATAMDSDLTGDSDSKVGTVSLWFKTSYSSAAQTFWGNAQTGLGGMNIDANGRLAVYGYDSGWTLRLNLVSSISNLCDGAWHHVIASWNLASAGTPKMYVDGTDRTLLLTEGDANVNWAAAGTWVVWDYQTGGHGPFYGSLCEVWVSVGEYTDITVQSTREKWRSSAGKPVNLGTDGSTPTGTQPLIYLRSIYSSFTVNSGSGGNFTVQNGSLLEDASAP